MFKNFQFIVVVLILSCLLASCRSAKEKIFLNPEFKLNEQLLFEGSFLKDFEENVSGFKKFEINFDKRKLSFDVQVEYVNEILTLVAMTPVKTRLFVSQYKENFIRYLPEPYFKAPLKPVYILRDFYLAEVSLKKLKKRLSLVKVKEEKNNFREFFLNDKKVIKIDYGQKEIVFENLLNNYTFKIKSR